MSAALTTLIEQVEQLLGDQPEREQLSIPGEWSATLSSYADEWRQIIVAIHRIEERVRELESSRRILLERIVEALRELA